MSTNDFAGFALDATLKAGISEAGYEKPTPIQAQTIAPALAGRHVLGLAQTGTGKTAAFVLPILQRLLSERHGGRQRQVRALVVAPTRELAEQINDEFRRLGRRSGLKSATVYGGVGFQPQVQALTGGADIIVACPGRLLDHVERGNADLRNVEVLVLDEADHMFDMGFLPAIRRIVGLVPQRSQRLLFS
ncbi:MAG TPA: DEAD/DEAH box helicase, partial [Trueperaceae bacterium]